MRGLIHIGANLGDEYKGTTRQNVLIEPLKDIYNQMVAIHKGNNNVTCLNYALGNYTGKVEMNVANNTGASSSILKPTNHLTKYPHIEFVGKETVDITKLDLLITRPSDFDEIVIDVQGYELEVFKGATETLKHITRIKTEVCVDELYEGNVTFDKLKEFLLEHNFRLETVDLYGGNWGDACFIKC